MMPADDGSHCSKVEAPHALIQDLFHARRGRREADERQPPPRCGRRFGGLVARVGVRVSFLEIGGGHRDRRGHSRWRWRGERPPPARAHAVGAGTAVGRARPSGRVGKPIVLTRATNTRWHGKPSATRLTRLGALATRDCGGQCLGLVRLRPSRGSSARVQLTR